MSKKLSEVDYNLYRNGKFLVVFFLKENEHLEYDNKVLRYYHKNKFKGTIASGEGLTWERIT